MTGTEPRERRRLALAVAAFLLYAGCYIWQTSFVLAGERHFVLFDDAMISMRYAENLAAGEGLVWNSGGERVEGYTNPLWVLVMALAHLAPVAKSKVALLVQIAGAGLLALELVLVKRLADRLWPQRPAVGWLALVLSATYLPLNMWTLQGFEVGLLAVLVTGAALFLAGDAERGRAQTLPFLLLGLATWVRPDMAVCLVVAIAVEALGSERRRRRRVLATGGAVLAVFLGIQTLLRLGYYGEVLPNTYYLKMTGYPAVLRLSRGLVVALEFAMRMNWVLFLLPFTVLLRDRRRPVVLLVALLAGQLAYSSWIGGDAWEWWGGSNRYVAFVMPLFFVLLAAQLDFLRRWAGARDPRLAAWLERPPRGRWLRWTVVAVCILSLNARYGPKAWAELFFLERPLHVADNELLAGAGYLVRDVTVPSARVAYAWAGTAAYYAERPAIDLLGKNDPVIARGPSQTPRAGKGFLRFKPGHDKWDLEYSLGVLAPDVVVGGHESLDDPAAPTAPYLGGRLGRLPLLFRCDSERIEWRRLSGILEPRSQDLLPVCRRRLRGVAGPGGIENASQHP